LEAISGSKDCFVGIDGAEVLTLTGLVLVDCDYKNRHRARLDDPDLLWIVEFDRLVAVALM
jgi:hypothetical protein